jgi:phospholipid transport system substrate-binding protein
MRTSAYPALVLAALLIVTVAAPAMAGAPTDQLKASVDQMIKLLQDPDLKGEAKAQERRAAIRQVATQAFDFSETARRALGRHWQGLNETQRQEFASLFTDLLESAYVSRIEQYSGETVTYVGDRLDPGGESATVGTRFVPKKGAEIPVHYRMLRRGDRWLVYDVQVEGVSLVSNYRSQFAKIMETASYEELVERLRSRRDEFMSPTAGPRKS